MGSVGEQTPTERSANALAPWRLGWVRVTSMPVAVHRVELPGPAGWSICRSGGRWRRRRGPDGSPVPGEQEYGGWTRRQHLVRIEAGDPPGARWQTRRHEL